MSDISSSTGLLEHASFPHLSEFEWNALHRLAAVSGETFVSSLLRSATADEHRNAVQEFLERERASLLARASTPASSKNDIVKIETSMYSGAGQDRLPLNRWYREVDIAMNARHVVSEQARVSFLLSRLSGKAKEWALGKLVYDASAFSTLAALQADLRLAFEPPQDESRMRAAFFALKQGKMSMSDYVQKARHLVSCVVTSPIDMASQVHVFVFGMREGMTRYCLVREEPKTLEAAFALALREDYTVASSYSRALSADARASTPEPMEIDAIEASATGSTGRPPRGGRTARPLICFRCRKTGHRAAECRAPAPVPAHAVTAQLASIDSSESPKNGQDQ
jgi:hypothetical protein